MAEASPYGKTGKGKGKPEQDTGKGKVLQQHDAPALRFEDSEPLPYSDPLCHYHISSSTRYYVNIYNWLANHKSDPALKVTFSSQLGCLLIMIQGLFTSTQRPPTLSPPWARI
jgi:hypothetical protein